MNASNLKLGDVLYMDSIIHSIVANTSLICRLSPEGQYEYIGDGTHKKILGYEPEEMIGRSLFDFVHPDDLVKIKSLFWSGLVYGQFKPVEFRYRCFNHDYIYLESQGVTVYDDNHCVSGAVFITNDITERIIMENQLARLGQLKAIGQLSASLLHEIRNPISTVRGFLQLLSDNDDLLKYRDYFEIMIRELDCATVLTSDMLSMAKEAKTDFAWQNLNDLIHSLYPILDAEAVFEDQKIILDLGELNEVYMDSNQIRQLIVNLVNNGLEAMGAGGILTIRTCAVGDNVVLTVEDHGSGIDSTIMDKIGTPFFTTKQQGTGLGLTICKNIAAAHQAEIKIESSIQGSTFSVWFKDFKAINFKSSLNGNKILAV